MKGLKERILNDVAQDLAAIEKALVENLNPYLPFVSHVAKYIMFSGGKRIRPLLMVLSARLCGYQGDYDKTLSVVFEYLHVATLLHDDVVDGAEVRRGNPVAHSIWGAPGTVLAGDFLLARSIAIGNPTDGYYALMVARQSGGGACTISDAEAVAGIKILAQTEGIFAEAAGGVVVSALKKLVTLGLIERNQLTVACITGAGPRTQEILTYTVRPFTVQPALESVEEVLGIPAL